ncbi:MAG TPA: methyl-accepting chemotaxis protein [Proteobacteria bacterium]|nr:methyl-accepting chemotaxis protein [Pseudomonadota bacterium]
MRVDEDPHVAQGRALLLNYLSPIEKGYLETLGLESFQLHFHLPTSRSFLHLWDKRQSKADDMSSFRETIGKIATPPHKALTGIEIGRGGFALRGIAPVRTVAGRYLGSVEVLSSYDPLVKSSIANRHETIAVYMNSEFLSIATLLKDQGKYPVVGGKYVRVTCTAAAISDGLVPSSLLDRGREGVAQEYRGNYMLTAFPVKDYQQRQIGVMVYVYDASERFSLRERTKWNIALLSLALLGIICLVLVLVLRTVTRPLEQAVGGLKEAADQVTLAAHEISGSSQILAESSSEQAAAAEETGSSLEDVASMARHNAENANSANLLSGQMD